MIIAIDETGDFHPKSELSSFFVAVFLQQQENNLEIKKNQFELWLDTISKEKLNKKNEIKGNKLNDNELFNFTKMVYLKKPNIFNQIIFFNPLNNSEKLMKSIKETEIESLNKTIMYYKKNKKMEPENFYKKMTIWYKNAKKMNYQHYMKLILLKKLINKSFNNVVALSLYLEILGEDIKSENLLNLKFKIDKDFIKGKESNLYWKELLRKSFLTFNSKNPIPFIKSNKKHPFLEKYSFNDKQELLLSKIFRENINFYDSDKNWEIQIADITAIIINRFYNKNKALDAYENIIKYNVEIEELLLTNQKK